MSSARASVSLLALSLALVVVACDHEQTGAKPSAAAPAELTLVAGQSDTAGRITWVITLDDTSGLVIGSFRIGVHYDTTSMRFVGANGVDSLFFAANDVGGKVLVAGASANGFGAGGWLALEFARRSATAAPASPAVEVLEIGGVTGGDLRERVAARPAWIPR